MTSGFHARIALGLTIALSGGALNAQSRPALPLAPCKVPGGTEMVRCAHLSVPEDWSRPKGREIALNIVVMPKVASGAEQPSVIWLDGGPGVPGTDDDSWIAARSDAVRLRACRGGTTDQLRRACRSQWAERSSARGKDWWLVPIALPCASRTTESCRRL